jgi:hypothetical protein
MTAASTSLFGRRWVTSGIIPNDPWHRETLIGVTRCGAALNLADMLTTLSEPAGKRCPSCAIPTPEELER